MKRNAVVTVLTLLGVGSILLVMLGSCKEKDVPIPIDEDEIINYLGHVTIAKELFRTTALFNESPYSVPFSSATITDKVISNRRTMEVYMVPSKVVDSTGDTVPNDPNNIYVDHGSLGRVRESIVRVDDRFNLQTTFAYANDTLIDTGTVTVTRYAFFLKLGSSTRDYLGWILWGFNGVGVTANLGVSLKGSAGAQFRGDLGLYDEEPVSNSGWVPHVPYIRLTSMDTVLHGSRLLVTTQRASYGTPTYQLISDYDNNGPFTRPMYRYDEANYLDSLSYQTPTSNPRTYNLMAIQSVKDIGFPSRTVFVVPYR